MRDKYIKIPNDLSVNEVWLYSFIYVQQNYFNQLNITALLLAQMLSFTGKRNNKKKVLMILHELENKQFIKVNEKENYLEISINDIRAGYEKINISEYLQFFPDRSAEEFFIYCYVKRYEEYKEGCICSFSRWQELLGVSNVTAQKIVQKMIDEKLINKKQAKRLPNGQQETNKYYTCRQQVQPKQEAAPEPEPEAPQAAVSNNNISIVDAVFGVINDDVIQAVHWGKKDGDNYLPIREEDYWLMLACERNNIYPDIVKKWRNIEKFAGKLEFLRKKFAEYAESYHQREHELAQETAYKNEEAFFFKHLAEYLTPEKSNITPFLVDGRVFAATKDNIDSVDVSQIEAIYARCSDYNPPSLPCVSDDGVVFKWFYEMDKDFIVKYWDEIKTKITNGQAIDDEMVESWEYMVDVDDDVYCPSK